MEIRKYGDPYKISHYYWGKGPFFFKQGSQMDNNKEGVGYSDSGVNGIYLLYPVL